MLFDSMTLAEGSQIANLTIASGTFFPSNASTGELFYRTDLLLLHAYNGSSWAAVGPGISTVQGDPYYNQTSLLLNFNGNNGAQYTADFSTRQNSIVFAPDAAISTSQAKFGSSSAYFNGDLNRYILVDPVVAYTGGLDLSTGSPDWTIEAWAYPTSLPPSTPDWMTLGMVLSWAGGWGISWISIGIVIDHTGIWEAHYNTSNNLGGNNKLSGGAAALNTWTHLALTRSGSTIRFFVNGILRTTSTIVAPPYFANASWGIGCASDSDNQRFRGYIDDVRITKGIARYTASFTPPTVAHPAFHQAV